MPGDQRRQQNPRVCCQCLALLGSREPCTPGPLEAFKMSMRNPLSLQALARQSLLSNPSMAISALEDLPVVLFPWFFQEVYAQGHTDVLKAMVQAWPFPCLPLGDLAWPLNWRTLNTVLDGLDLLLAKKERPSQWKLQVLDLRNERPDIWTHGIHSMAQISCPDPLTESGRASGHSGMNEDQPLMIAIDLKMQNFLVRGVYCDLIEWAIKRKGRVQLFSRKLHLFTSEVMELKMALHVVRLDSIQELLLEGYWAPENMHRFVPYLKQMKNLHIIKCGPIFPTNYNDSQENYRDSHMFGLQLGKLEHIKELYMEDFYFNGNLHLILERLTHLKTLSVRLFKMKPWKLRYLSQCPCIRQLKQLRLRTLFMDTFNPEPWQALLKQLAGTLEALALEECNFTDDSLSAILPALSQCSQLCFFSFYGNHISMTALKNLLSHTARLGHLTQGIYPAPLESYPFDTP
ncbi:PRAME family member 12-like [Thomomys bottae]